MSVPTDAKTITKTEYKSNPNWVLHTKEGRKGGKKLEKSEE